MISALRDGRRAFPRVLMAIVLVMGVAGGIACRADARNSAGSSTSTLRVGVAQLAATSQINGLRQLSQILSVEGLLRAGEDGRMQPWLADNVASSSDGRTLTVHLRSNVKFHDGSPLDAATVGDLLPKTLQSFMGTAYSDVQAVRVTDSKTLSIELHAPSPFLLEPLEAPIQKPGAGVIGTGPFAVAADSTTDMHANLDYYLGRPDIGLIHVQTYPSVRTAWAEMLRNQLDVLYEVGTDALDLMKNSTTVSLFTFTRKYQHAIVLNSHAPALRSAEIRRALSYAVDRAALVNGPLNGYGVASSGPIWPRHWALPDDLQQFTFDPKRAVALFNSAHQDPTRFRFTCLVSPSSVEQRIALEVKRQLASIGVDMQLEEASREQIVQRGTNRDYEAAMIEVVSGPTIFRDYLTWHSAGALNWGS